MTLRALTLAISFLFLVTLPTHGLAAPGDPFGGDDTGCIPLDADKAKCEAAVAKALGKAMACIVKCHRSRASGKLADATAEEACETTDPVKSCRAKYERATNSASKIDALCPAQLDATKRAAQFSVAEAFLDANNGGVFPCTTTTTTSTTSTTTTSTSVTTTTLFCMSNGAPCGTCGPGYTCNAHWMDPPPLVCVNTSNCTSFGVCNGDAGCGGGEACIQIGITTACCPVCP